MSKRRRHIVVSVPVPRDLFIPRTVKYRLPNPIIFGSRYRRIDLARPTFPVVMRRVKVELPPLRPLRPVPSAWAVNRKNQVVVSSKRAVRRLFSRVPPEWNRVRYVERKEKFHKHRHGQMESIRGDRANIIAASVLGGGTPAQLADAAMVSRALGYS